MNKKTLATILMSSILSLPVYAITSSNADENKGNKFHGCLLSEEMGKGLEQKVEKIKWYNSFKKAQNIAEKKQKPMMVDFTADWCGWCIELDKTTFKDPEVIRFSQNYVNVKVDVDKEKNKELQKGYELTGLPTILFLHEDGSELKRVIGYRKARTFIKLMEEALAKYKGQEIDVWNVPKYDLEGAEKYEFYVVLTDSGLELKEAKDVDKKDEIQSMLTTYFIDRNKDKKADLVHFSLQYFMEPKDMMITSLYIDDPKEGVYDGIIDRLLVDAQDELGNEGADGKIDYDDSESLEGETIEDFRKEAITKPKKEK